MMAGAINAIGAIGALVGTFLNFSGSRSEAEAQQEQQTLIARTERRSALRKERIARATLLSNAQAAGAAGSSAVLGGQASLRSQLGSGLGFQSQYTALSRDITDARSLQQAGAFFSNIGGAAFNRTGGFNTLGTTFGFNNQDQQQLSFR